MKGLYLAPFSSQGTPVSNAQAHHGGQRAYDVSCTWPVILWARCCKLCGLLITGGLCHSRGTGIPELMLSCVRRPAITVHVQTARALPFPLQHRNLQCCGADLQSQAHASVCTHWLERWPAWGCIWLLYRKYKRTSDREAPQQALHLCSKESTGRLRLNTCLVHDVAAVQMQPIERNLKGLRDI